MFYRFPIRRLILPSALAALVCLVGSAVVGSQWWERFLQNLSTTFIGILLAAVYVDVVQQSFQDEQWRQVKTHVNNRTLILTASIISLSASWIGRVLTRQNLPSVRSVDQLEEVGTFIESNIDAALLHYRLEDLREFAGAIRHVGDRIDKIIDLYGRFFSSNTFYQLLVLSDRLGEVDTLLRTLDFLEMASPLAHEVIASQVRDDLKNIVVAALSVERELRPGQASKGTPLRRSK